MACEFVVRASNISNSCSFCHVLAKMRSGHICMTVKLFTDNFRINSKVIYSLRELGVSLREQNFAPPHQQHPTAKRSCLSKKDDDAIYCVHWSMGSRHRPHTQWIWKTFPSIFLCEKFCSFVNEKTVTSLLDTVSHGWLSAHRMKSDGVTWAVSFKTSQ